MKALTRLQVLEKQNKDLRTRLENRQVSSRFIGVCFYLNTRFLLTFALISGKSQQSRILSRLLGCAKSCMSHGVSGQRLMCLLKTF